MSGATEETRERIVLAAIECIERVGVAKVTVRAIAQEANVNVASVNYHFGSKDALIEQALEYALGNFYEDLDSFLNKDYPSADEGLSELFSYLLDGVTRYSGITRAQLAGPFLDGDCNRPYINRLMRFLRQFGSKLVVLETGRSASKVRIRLEQGVSAMLFRAMVPQFFEQFSPLKMDDVVARKRYLGALLCRDEEEEYEG